jgi:nascent polypeptide-associated complex subunit alpha
MDPRMVKQAMKRMGIQQHEVDATEVIIRCPDKEIYIRNPEVSRINMMGQETFQVAGEIEEREISTDPDINDEDVKTVVEQTGVSEELARKTIKECKGDLAEAILKLEEE